MPNIKSAKQVGTAEGRVGQKSIDVGKREGAEESSCEEGCKGHLIERSLRQQIKVCFCAQIGQS